MRSGGIEKEEASNKLTTGLQHACNKPATKGLVRHGSGVGPVALGGHERVVPPERPTGCAVDAARPVTAPARYGLARVLLKTYCLPMTGYGANNGSRFLRRGAIRALACRFVFA